MSDIVQLHHGDYHAAVLLAGGGLRDLTHRDIPMVRGSTPGEVVSQGRGQVLIPWPNRLRDGRYRFAGAQHQLALSEPGRRNASHGLVRWCTWQVIDQDDSSALLGYRLAAQSGYPWTLDVTARYRLHDDGLTLTLSATNVSGTACPFAAGMHPYLDAGVPLDQTRLTLPATVRQLTDERLLPTTTEPVPSELDFTSPRPLAQVTLDDAFTGLTRDRHGRVLVRLEGEHAVELWADEGWPWLQAYSGDDLGDQARTALAVEPMTAPADAFNSGTDLLVLAPGESWSGRLGIRRGD